MKLFLATNALLASGQRQLWPNAEVEHFKFGGFEPDEELYRTRGFKQRKMIYLPK